MDYFGVIRIYRHAIRTIEEIIMEGISQAVPKHDESPGTITSSGRLVPWLDSEQTSPRTRFIPLNPADSDGKGPPGGFANPRPQGVCCSCFIFCCIIMICCAFVSLGNSSAICRRMLQEELPEGLTALP
jgi:hypothetical protein